MAVILAGGCRVSHMHDGAALVEGTLRVWNQVGRATGAQAISLRVMEIAPGLSPAIRNDDCGQILYVLERGPSMERGHLARMSDRSERSVAAALSTIFIDGQRHEIGPDTGIYIRPKETFAIENTGPDALTIISGEGRIWGGETNTPIAPGSCVYLPNGQVHCVENTGEEELRLLGVFYPAGSPSVRYEY